MWRHGFAAASLSFDSSLPQAKEDLAPSNSMLKPLLAAPFAAPFAPLHLCFFPILFCPLVRVSVGVSGLS